MSQEIRTLAASGNRKLILYALKRWAQECPTDPEPLIVAFRSTDEEVLKALLPLATSSFPALFAPYILALLDHPEFLPRRLAVEALQPAHGKEAPNRLRRHLEQESHSHVLASGVLAAARLGLEPAAIARFLEHEDLRVRANTIRAIAACPGDHRSLLEPMMQDPALRVQTEAIKALARFIPEPELLELLDKRLQSPKFEVRATTAMLIADLPIASLVVSLQNLLPDPAPQVSVCAARALVKRNDPLGFRALAAFYLVPERPAPADTRWETFATLLRSLPPEHLLVAAEKHGQPLNAPPDIATRLLAVALENPHWEKFLPWIVTGLERKESPVRVSALRLVQRHTAFFSRPPETFGELLERAERSREPLERALAARIRLNAGQLSGLETLETMLRAPDQEIRRVAAEVLRSEPSLLADRALQTARAAGIREAFPDEAGAGVSGPAPTSSEAKPPKPRLILLPKE